VIFYNLFFTKSIFVLFFSFLNLMGEGVKLVCLFVCCFSYFLSVCLLWLFKSRLSFAPLNWYNYFPYCVIPKDSPSYQIITSYSFCSLYINPPTILLPFLSFHFFNKIFFFFFFSLSIFYPVYFNFSNSKKAKTKKYILSNPPTYKKNTNNPPKKHYTQKPTKKKISKIPPPCC